MIGKLKKMLGLDGLKLEIVTAESHDADKSLIDGELVLISKYDLKIDSIEIRIIEKYTRGRLSSKKTDEYNIGSIRTGFSLEMRGNKLMSIPFKVPVDYLKSSMDRFASRNFIFKGIAKGAKILKGVRSKYRIEVEAKVVGSQVKPFVRKDVKVV